LANSIRPAPSKPFNTAYPEINVISNVVENGKPIGGLGDGEAVWPAEMTYVEVLPKAAILHAIEVSPDGGNTFAAYETLLKDAVEGRARCMTRRSTAPVSCAKGTRRSPTCERPSGRDIRSCAQIVRPVARLCFSAVGATAT
jgi:alpha-ketoglutarate-dependent taurine dioxygenase